MSIDDSGIVDIDDLFAVLSDWGECEFPEDCPADINGDGMNNDLAGDFNGDGRLDLG